MLDGQLFGSFSPTFASCLVLFSGLALLYGRRNRKRVLYPPGPIGLPLIGNIFDIPTKYQWIAYNEIGKKLNSPLVHVTMFGAHIVSVNDFKVAQEIFEKRGFRHGDRPRLMFLREITGHYWNFSTYSPDAFYKACRKVFDGRFKPTEVKRMRARFTNMTQGRMLKQLREDPEDLEHRCHSYCVMLFLEIIFGLTNLKYGDPFIRDVEKSLHAANLSGNFQFMEAFPSLRFLPSWFPGMSWKSEVTHWQACTRNFYEMPFNAVKNAMHDGTAKTSVASELLEEEGKNNYGEEVIRASTSSGIGAGVDTVVSMMQCVFLCMSIFPDSQKMAQDELDRVVGPNRMPDFNDEAQLPYVKAVYREMLRWFCVAPLAVAHQSMEDDIWVHGGKEYFIPKGSVMLANAWAMCRDPEMYPDPEKFDPGRFLTKDGKLNPEVREADMPFGFRPRHCPGRWYAEDFLFIFIASVLSVFRIETEDGKPAPSTEWTEVMKPGFILYPKPFKCKISARNEASAELIQSSEASL